MVNVHGRINPGVAKNDHGHQWWPLANVALSAKTKHKSPDRLLVVNWVHLTRPGQAWNTLSKTVPSAQWCLTPPRHAFFILDEGRTKQN
jgi:hypothetical protein